MHSQRRQERERWERRRERVREIKYFHSLVCFPNAATSGIEPG